MRDHIQATIITIGDELLIGQVIDTNSAFIAQKLNAIGVTVQQRIAVGDDAISITNALDTAIQKSQIVILTGGLGPTADDITKPLLNRYFGLVGIFFDELRHSIINDDELQIIYANIRV